MEIKYKKINDFTEKELQDLFLSVNWDSGNYPDKLKKAMRNSHCVYSAWAYDEDRGQEILVGLINSLSDGVMTVYFHYLLVRPEYQGKGIGKKLVELCWKNTKAWLVLQLLPMTVKLISTKNVVLSWEKVKVPCL